MEHNKQQAISFFNDLIRTSSMEKKVKDVRAALGIPREGLNFSRKYKNEFNSEILQNLYTPSDIEKITGFPTWTFINLILLCEKIIRDSTDLVSPNLPVLLRFYILFNEINEDLLTNKTSSETIRIGDTDDELGFYHIAKSEADLRSVLEEIYERGQTYPMTLQFTPHVSKKQLIDFIKANWDHVESMRKHYGSDVITKLRKRDPELQKRNDFIYKNRGKPLDELMKLVARGFPDLQEEERYLDLSAISTIKNNEIEKREKDYKAT